MRNRTYGGVRGRKTKVGRKLLRFPPTRLLDHAECYLLMRRMRRGKCPAHPINALLGIPNVLLLSTLRKLHQLL